MPAKPKLPQERGLSGSSHAYVLLAEETGWTVGKSKELEEVGFSSSSSPEAAHLQRSWGAGNVAVAT